MSITRTIKGLLPRPVAEALGNWRMRRRGNQLAKLSASEAFDEVYRRKMWKQGQSLSGPGSEGRWATDYATFVASIIQETNARSIVDLGCGDFEVGKLLAPLVERYIGVDVSGVVVEMNRKRYAHLQNVEFRQGDITSDLPPGGDLILVRQVLQHLTNKQIMLALRNIERAEAKTVLVTEHATMPAKMDAPNVDLPSHSVMTRVAMKSGVDVRKAPFDRPAELLAVLAPGEDNLAEADSGLFIYRLGLPAAVAT